MWNISSLRFKQCNLRFRGKYYQPHLSSMKGLLRLRDVLNVIEQDAIFVAASWLNLIPFLWFQTGKSYKIRLKLSCYSEKIIYFASCKKCRQQFIGPKTNDFRVRFRNHRSAMVTNKKTWEVAVHFNKTTHDLSDFCSCSCSLSWLHSKSSTSHDGWLTNGPAGPKAPFIVHLRV